MVYKFRRAPNNEKSEGRKAEGRNTYLALSDSQKAAIQFAQALYLEFVDFYNSNLPKPNAPRAQGNSEEVESNALENQYKSSRTFEESFAFIRNGENQAVKVFSKYPEIYRVIELTTHFVYANRENLVEFDLLRGKYLTGNFSDDKLSAVMQSYVADVFNSKDAPEFLELLSYASREKFSVVLAELKKLSAEKVLEGEDLSFLTAAANNLIIAIKAQNTAGKVSGGSEGEKGEYTQRSA